MDDVLATARDRYGPDFAAILETSRVWLNGNPTDGDAPVATNDELAILPPVSGGT